MYDLFSVIIHKGGCYGGHYHVYIKDVDHLGNWQFQVSIEISLRVSLQLFSSLIILVRLFFGHFLYVHSVENS